MASFKRAFEQVFEQWKNFPASIKSNAVDAIFKIENYFSASADLKIREALREERINAPASWTVSSSKEDHKFQRLTARTKLIKHAETTLAESTLRLMAIKAKRSRPSDGKLRPVKRSRPNSRPNAELRMRIIASDVKRKILAIM